MSARNFTQRMACVSLLSVTLSGCFHPPYNDFKKPPPNVKRAVAGATAGAIAGSLVGGTAAGGLVGGAIGGTLGTFAGIYHAGKQATIRDLQRNDIQFVQYGDTMVLVIPTDHYYQFNSPKLNDICFAGLNNIIKLLKLYDCSTVYVAAFTDNVGTREHKKRLSQARAETMLTFLWANNIRAKRLKAEGYGDKFDIGDNHLIHGSAYNRRIEIQWQNKSHVVPPQRMDAVSGGMK